MNLAGSIIHIEDRVRREAGIADHGVQGFGRKPDGGGESRCSGKNSIILQQSVQAHQSAHGAAGDKGVPAVRQSRVMAVNQRLKGVDPPIHRRLAASGDMSQLGIREGKRRVLGQASAVGAVVAFYSNNHVPPGELHYRIYLP